MNAPDPALLNSLMTPSATGLIVHLKSGASHGLTSVANYVELERRLGKPLLKFNPLLCADSVGALCAAFIAAPSAEDAAAPRYSSDQYLQIYADNVVDLLSRDADVAGNAIRQAVGDYTLSEALTALHISASEIVADDFNPTYFRSHPDAFRRAYPDLKFGEERGAGIEVWKAAMASSTSLLHRGSFPIEMDGVTRKFTDIAILEFHAHLLRLERDFRMAYPSGMLIKVDLGNNSFSSEAPDTRVGGTWLLRQGPKQLRRLLQKQQGLIYAELVNHLIDLSLVVPKGQTIPSAFSNRPEHINRVMEWTQEMIARPEHQEKLDQAAELILAAFDLPVPEMGPAPLWPRPLPVRESRVAPIATMGSSFVKSATPVVRGKAADLATQASSWLGQHWRDTALPWLRHQMASLDETLLPSRNRAFSNAAKSRQPLLSHSSEQHTPSESECKPL